MEEARTVRNSFGFDVSMTRKQCAEAFDTKSYVPGMTKQSCVEAFPDLWRDIATIRGLKSFLIRSYDEEQIKLAKNKMFMM